MVNRALGPDILTSVGTLATVGLANLGRPNLWGPQDGLGPLEVDRNDNLRHLDLGLGCGDELLIALYRKLNPGVPMNRLEVVLAVNEHGSDGALGHVG